MLPEDNKIPNFDNIRAVLWVLLFDSGQDLDFNKCLFCEFLSIFYHL